MADNTTTITVKTDTWRLLAQAKLDHNLPTLDAAIIYLVALAKVIDPAPEAASDA